MVLGGGLLGPLYSEVETEAGRGGVTCPRSHRVEVTLRQALLSPPMLSCPEPGPSWALSAAPFSAGTEHSVG